MGGATRFRNVPEPGGSGRGVRERPQRPKHCLLLASALFPLLGAPEGPPAITEKGLQVDKDKLA